MVQVLQFKVIMEQDEDGRFIASVPSVPGCYAQGKTYEEALTSVREALDLTLEVAKENKDVREKITFPDKEKKSTFVGLVDLPVRFAL